MAGWISSKLKVAENILQQIDQQAAESLKKDGKSQLGSASDDSSGEIPDPKKIDSAPPAPAPLKYQLSRKSSARSPSPVPSPSLIPPDAPTHQLQPSPSPSTGGPDPAVIDWTELLSSPSPVVPVVHPNEGDRRSKKTHNRKHSIPAPPAPALDRKERVPSPSPSVAIGRSGEKSLPVGIHREKKDDGDGKDTAARREDDDESTSLESEDSETDSEEERQRMEERRKRREQMIAEKAAAAAAKAIKEREDTVTRLEGEKESLEKTLEERQKQAAKEASELQMNMIETMEAVELEKQKHNSTRMEAFTCLAKLEITNAELARSFATAQWNLETEVNRISELSQRIELKKLAQEEHKRRLQKIHQKRVSPCKEEPSRKDELKQEILDAEYSFVCNKLVQLNEKANMFEVNIGNARQERVYPSEVEIELKKRVTQLTDHLIQKQTQVEALSSEKATLSLRIEMISSLLDEHGVTQQTSDVSYGAVPLSGQAAMPLRFDIEAGTWRSLSKSEALREKIRSGQQQLGWLVQQLDILFSAGAIFIRRNPMAQLGSLIYLFCLHIWVAYVLLSSNPQVSDSSSGHGAVFSLENINKTSGS